MKLKIVLRMKVFAQRPDEAHEALKLNERIEDLSLNDARRRAVVDESLLADFTQILSDLHQLMNRANARRKRGRRG